MPFQRLELGVTFEDLQQRFHMPLLEVSREYGVSLTYMKKLCRSLGIPRWPHRKVKALEARAEKQKESDRSIMLKTYRKKPSPSDATLAAEECETNTLAVDGSSESSRSVISSTIAGSESSGILSETTDEDDLLLNVTPAFLCSIERESMAMGQPPCAVAVPYGGGETSKLVSCLPRDTESGLTNTGKDLSLFVGVQNEALLEDWDLASMWYFNANELLTV